MAAPRPYLQRQANALVHGIVSHPLFSFVHKKEKAHPSHLKHLITNKQHFALHVGLSGFTIVLRACRDAGGLDMLRRRAIPTTAYFTNYFNDGATHNHSLSVVYGALLLSVSTREVLATHDRP